MQRENGLQVFFLDRDKAHVGSANGFADGGGVRRVVFAALAGEVVEGNKLRSDEFDCMAVAAEQPCSVVSAGAGFEADQARWELGNQWQQLIP